LDLPRVYISRNRKYDIPICTQAISFPVQETELLMLQPELWLCSGVRILS